MAWILTAVYMKLLDSAAIPHARPPGPSPRRFSRAMRIRRVDRLGGLGPRVRIRGLKATIPTRPRSLRTIKNAVGEPIGRAFQIGVGTGSVQTLRLHPKEVDVVIVANTVELSLGGEVIKRQPIRRDRRREFGAFSRLLGKSRTHRSA